MITNSKCVDFPPQSDDFSRELVSQHRIRRGRNCVPLCHVKIAGANSTALDLDDHLAGGRRGIWPILDDEWMADLFEDGGLHACRESNIFFDRALPALRRARDADKFPLAGAGAREKSCNYIGL